MEDGVPLPKDVLSEILIYLQVKSLLRFKCVSRYWCALIKSPSFATRHLKYDCKEILLLKRYVLPESSNEIRRDGENVLSFHNLETPNLLVWPNLSIPYLKDIVAQEHVKLFGPCNGLVCIIFKDINILCNPILREFKLIPSDPFGYPEGHVKRILGWGFGFDANNNSYKLIQICNIEENEASHINEEEYFGNFQHYNSYFSIQLYNSNTNTWSIIDTVVPAIWQNPGFDLFFNGACHWQTFEYTEGPPTMGIILSFDVSTEVFQKFEFPDFFEDGKHASLVVLNELLSLVRYMSWTIEPHLVDIWVMKEYGVSKSWIKELAVGPYLFRNPFLFWKNEWLVVETIDSNFAYHALHTNEIKKFQFPGLKESFRALFLTESLISLDMVS